MPTLSSRRRKVRPRSVQSLENAAPNLIVKKISLNQLKSVINTLSDFVSFFNQRTVIRSFHVYKASKCLSEDRPDEAALIWMTTAVITWEMLQRTLYEQRKNHH